MSTRSEETPSRPNGGAVGWETVHIFISSTFNDMHAERDYLVKEVFPELRDWCEERKLRLVDIDLRWGVSEADATHNQRVVEVCLHNIDRCRPFFLCFLGQRYGWIPGAGNVFAETLARYPGLQSAIAEQRSVTELEVLHAVVAPFVGGSAKLAAGQSFFYLRNDDYLKDMPAEPVQLKRIYSDEAEEDAQSRAFLVDRQNKLREAVSGQKQRPARQYSARWSNARRTPELAMPLDCPATLRENQDRWRRDWQRSGEVSIPEGALSVPAAQAEKARAYNQRLCVGRLGDFWSDGRSLTEVIVDDLKAAILERYPEREVLPEQDDLSREIDRHEDFVRTAADVFIERPGDFADVDEYAAGNSQKLFVLVAKAGLGKSTLLANWVARWRSRDGKPADETEHARFVGVGEQSNNVDSLLRSILEELRRTGKLSSELPDNPNVLRSKLAELLGECGKKGRTIVVIDALNQLQSGLTDLDWLARTLPENVKLVVSFKLGDAAGDALAAQLRADERVALSEVRPFAGLEERRQLVRQFLRQFLKELDEQHLETLIQAEGADNPLFLKVVLTELRVFGAFGQLGEVIRREFGTTPQSAFEAVLRRLESDPSYAAVSSQQAVPLLFGLLAHSRSGLPEDLLARMFLAELGLGEERLADMAATIQLFLRQVRPFLARRDGRVDFFYENFQLAARDRYSVALGPLARETGKGQRDDAHAPEPQAEQLKRPMTIWQGLLARLRGRRRKGEGVVEPPVNISMAASTAAETSGTGAYSPKRQAEDWRRPAAAWHTRLARACERWAELDGAAKRYALANLVHHEVQAGNGAAAAEAMANFGYHYERLKALGRNDVVNITADFVLAETAVGLSPAMRDHLGVWRAFHAESAHLLRREVHNLVPETYLLQLALAHADTSPVTRSAEGWLESTGSEVNWLRSLRRPHEVEHSACLRTFEGHTSQVAAVAVLPDGRRAVSGSYDGTLKLWNLQTGQFLRTLGGHAKGVLAVAVFPDGYRAISGGMDNSLKLWDLQTGQCLRTFEGHKHRVTAVAPLPDGQRAVSGSHDGTLKLWDLQTGRCLHTFEGHTGVVVGVGVMPDGRRVISGSQDATLKLWDLRTGECLRTFGEALVGAKPNVNYVSVGFGPGGTKPVEAVAVLPDGSCAISGGQDWTLKLWNLESGKCLRKFEGHTGIVEAVAVLPDGRRAVSASLDKTLKLWDLQTGKCLRTFERDDIDALAVLPDGRRAILAGRAGLRLWNLGAEEPQGALERHKDSVPALALLRDGRRVISGSRDGTLKVWDLHTGQCLRTFERHTLNVSTDGDPQYPVDAVEVLPDGRRVILRSSIVNVPQLWDLEPRERLATFRGHTSDVTAVALLPDGRHLISGSHDKTLKLWNLQTGQCLRTIEGHTGEVYAVAVLPDGRRAISGGRDCTLKLWSVESGGCLRTFHGHAKHVQKIAVLPDGHRAISMSGDQTLKLWNLETGECLATFQTHMSFLRTMALLPDGRRVIAGCGDNSLKLWDLQTGGCLATFEGHQAEVFTVALSPDGTRVISGGSDGTVKLWDLRTGLCLATWQAVAGVGSCAAGPEIIVAGTHDGEVLFLKLMPPGRITPEAIAATWHLSRPLLAVARANGTILVQEWHPASLFLEEVARRYGSAVERMQWSRDGAHLLAIARDGTRRILDAATLREASAPACPWADPRDISPDGAWRAVIRDGRLEIVPTAPPPNRAQ